MNHKMIVRDLWYECHRRSFIHELARQRWKSVRTNTSTCALSLCIRNFIVKSLDFELRSRHRFNNNSQLHCTVQTNNSPNDVSSFYCKLQMEVRVVFDCSPGDLIGVTLWDSCRMIDALIVRVASESFFGRTMCISCAETCRKTFSTDSPVFADTKKDGISLSLANCWCFSSFTARKCSRSPKNVQHETPHGSNTCSSRMNISSTHSIRWRCSSHVCSINMR